MTRKAKEKSWPRRILCIVLILVLILLAAVFAVFVYVTNYADETALRALQSDETVTITETEYGWLFDGPSEDTAWVFYPGAKVDEKAYAPLMHTLAERGLDVCLLRLPLHNALFNINAASKALKAHSYKKWYIGGHSLGGVVSAWTAANHAENYSGVILLASYPVTKIPDSLTMLQLIGSEDTILDWNKVEQRQSRAPSHTTQVIIEGGNHAQFGNYGRQGGDGQATISAEEQQRQTIDAILAETLG